MRDKRGGNDNSSFIVYKVPHFAYFMALNETPTLWGAAGIFSMRLVFLENMNNMAQLQEEWVHRPPSQVSVEMWE